MACVQTKMCSACGAHISANNFVRHHAKCTGPKPESAYKGKRGGWNKGISLRQLLDTDKITEQQYNARLEGMRRGGKNSPGQPYDEARRLARNNKCRANAIKAKLGGHTSKQKLKYVTKCGQEVYLQSSYEIRFATLLDKLDVSWTRPSPLMWIDVEGIPHRYYPDFLIGNIYVDTKNDYLAVKDLPKINAAMEQNCVTIKIVTNNQINEQFIKALQT